MKIETKNGYLDMNSDDGLEIERVNPLFAEEGSASLSFEIRDTPNNTRILDFPHDLSKFDKFCLKFPVNIQTGSFSEPATLQVESAEDEIDGFLLLNETSFYTQVNEKKLTEVFEGKVRKIYSESTAVSSKITYWINRMQSIINSTVIDPDYSCFPIITEVEESDKTGNDVWFFSIGSVSLNGVEIVNDKPILLGSKERTIKDKDGSEIKLPKGYAIAPFLRVSYVLKEIFKYFDLTLTDNVYFSDPLFADKCVVHNTMDAIMFGEIVESQLVPDCTVNDFLDAIRSLCCDFYIDVHNKTAKLVFFKDMVNQEPDMDLTPYITKKRPKIIHNCGKQLKLRAKTDLPMAAPVVKTYKELNKKYPNIIDNPFFGAVGIFYYSYLNSYFKGEINADNPSGWFGSNIKATRLGSGIFDYDMEEDLEYETHELPFQQYVRIGVIGSSSPVIGSMRHLNSHILLHATSSSEKEVVKDSDEIECPIIFAFARKGFFYGMYGDFENITTDGSGKGISLLPHRIQSLFWNEYDNMLHHSFHEVTYQLRLPVHILHNFKFDRTKVINGQELAPVALRYTAVDADFLEVEFEAKTVRIYASDVPNPPIEDIARNFFIGEWKLHPDLSVTDYAAYMKCNSDFTGEINFRSMSNKIATTFSNLVIEKQFNNNTWRSVLVFTTPIGLKKFNIYMQSENPKFVSFFWTDVVGFTSLVAK